MARSCLRILLFWALACGFAVAQPLKPAGEWEYHYFNKAKEKTGRARVILLAAADGTHKLRFQTERGEHPPCFSKDVDVAVERKDKVLILTPVLAEVCGHLRLVIDEDGSGGVRENRNDAGVWRKDGLDRSLRKLEPLAMIVPKAPAKPQPANVAKLRARALVIGNSAYQGFGKLPNPRNDAEAIAAKFKSLGIETELLLDADRDGLAKALNDFANGAAGSDVNILYYAGHGLQVDGVNYLVPTNLKAEGISPAYIKLNAISLNAALDAMPARVRLVFLDACRDNPASRALAATRGSAPGLAPVSVTTSGTLIAYATRDGSTAEDGKGKHSPYTAALLEHLSRPQDIAVVLRHVRESVMKATHNRQEPWEYGSLVGDQLILARMAR